jgi:signal transduction histidine kinase
MKRKVIILVASLALSVAVWIMNAAIDSLFFEEGSFFRMIWQDLSLMQITHRLIMVAGFLILGLILANVIQKLKITNEKLLSQKSDLNNKVKELDCLYGISKLNEIKEITNNELLSGIVRFLDSALPAGINSKLLYRNDVFDNENSYDQDEIFSANIIVAGDKQGAIKLYGVSYFLTPEIKRLVIAVAERTGKILERRENKEKLKEARDRLRQLAAYLNTNSEKERKAIAREIHDELGQVLTALKINLSIISKQIKDTEAGIDAEALQEEINDMNSILDSTIGKVRKMITQLRPEVLDNLGLIEALIWQTNIFKEQTGINIDFSYNKETNLMNKDVEITVFRIYQEALTNIARHSKAKNVKTDFLCMEKSLILTIRDDGIGITDEIKNNTRSFGILGMKERAIICGGELSINRIMQGGTLVELIIPVIDGGAEN